MTPIGPAQRRYPCRGREGNLASEQGVAGSMASRKRFSGIPVGASVWRLSPHVQMGIEEPQCGIADVLV
ncbi:MAG: hypothetical protein L0H73_05325 [Nitrococcus sp.]|nr:hypothetical protein [Nitrococcus sp.]